MQIKSENFLPTNELPVQHHLTELP